MANFSAKILNNSVSALNAQQAVIATTANNIANVNTPGYARRTIDLQTRVTRGTQAGIDVGNGVEIGRVTRITDEFVERLLRGAQNDAGKATVKNDFLDRLQGLFGLTDNDDTIGTNLTEFFKSVDELTVDPSSIELRTVVIQKANNLTSSIRSTYNNLADLQAEADQRIYTEIENVNGITAEIARLNGLVSAREAGTGTVAGDERDQRDILVQKLSEKLNIKVVEQSDGQLNISLDNGLALVVGSDARSLDVTTNPSFLSGPAPASLGGGILGYIVYDYSGGAGTAHVDLSDAITGGTIGGLLDLRGRVGSATTPFAVDGTIVEVASRVEAITRNLLTSLNTTYLGPDRDGGTAGHQPSSYDLDGNRPGVFGLFTFTGAADANTNGLPETSDLTASGNDNFSSLLQVTISNPRSLAAGRDNNVNAADPTTFARGDGQNIEAISALRDTSYTFTLGSYSFTGTLEGAYNETVTKVGNDKSRAELEKRVAESSLEAAQNGRDEISGVSLDEEFTSLIKFQKAYQAAARMISVGEKLLDEVIALL